MPSRCYSVCVCVCWSVVRSRWVGRPHLCLLTNTCVHYVVFIMLHIVYGLLFSLPDPARGLDVEPVAYTVWVKKIPPPRGLVAVFPKRLGIFQPNFTCLLCVPTYARLQIFIQLPATLTKLCHIKCDQPAWVSADGGHFEHDGGRA